MSLPTAEQVPAELLDQRVFVCWKKVLDNDKVRKPPHSPVTGEAIGAVEKYREHFVTFSEALEGSQKHGLDGIGIVLGNGLVGVDLDGAVVEGQVRPEAQALLDEFPSWQELSPSGKGVHVIGRGNLEKALTATLLCDGCTVEAYGHSRFFTITGNLLNEPKLAFIHNKVAELVARLSRPAPGAAAPKENTKPLSRHDLRSIYFSQLEKLRAASQGQGNTLLNNVALIAARVCASGVFDKTADQFKQELLDIVTKEWKSPHPEQGAKDTIESGWGTGESDGAYNVRPIILAINAADYCAIAPEKREHLVEGLIYKGTATQLIATIKDGKTTWAMAMINALETGRDFIGKKTTKATVLYITEQPLASFQDQLIRAGLRNSKHLHILEVGRLFNLDWNGRTEIIRENAIKLNADLVVIDTFPRIAMIEDLKDASKMNLAYDAISPIVNEEHRTLLLIWHSRKSGGPLNERALGTVASGGAVDMLIGLQRPENAKPGERARIIQTMGRFPAAFDEAGTISLNEDMTDYTFEGKPHEVGEKNFENHVLSLVPSQGEGSTKDQIFDRHVSSAKSQGMEPKSDRTIERTINELVEKGLLIRKGKGGKGDPARFTCAQSREQTNIPF